MSGLEPVLHRPLEAFVSMGRPPRGQKDYANIHHAALFSRVSLAMRGSLVLLLYGLVARCDVYLCCFVDKPRPTAPGWHEGVGRFGTDNGLLTPPQKALGGRPTG